MDVANTIQVLLRHWLILLIGLTLTAGGAYAVYRVTPRSYEATSQTMLLLRPTASNPDLETSPFLYLPDGLVVLARVVSLIPNTPEYRASMAAEGFEPSYTVALQGRDPIVLFSVEGSDPENVLRTRGELMARFEADLDRVQEEEGVPDRQWAHVRVLEASDIATATSKGAFRQAAGVAGFGGLLTLLGIALLERRSHRGAPAAARTPVDLPPRTLGTQDDSRGSAPRRPGAIAEDAADPPPSGSWSAARDPVHASEVD